MARDYLAIPATTCIAERSFSLSARTDDPRRRQMKKVKFGGLQKIRAGYMDGRLNVDGEIMQKFIGDFDFDDEDYLE
jgi:hAT family C-terminal dimerisation region